MDGLESALFVGVAMALAWAPLRARSKDGLPAAVYAGAVAALAGLLAVAGWRAPETFSAWAQEDSWLELLTAAVLVAGAVRWASVARGAAGRRRWIALALAALCVGIAGEEVSWGQRWFALAPPEYLLAHNFQQELNVHNVLQGDAAPIRITGKAMVVALCAVWLTSAAAARWRRWGAAPPAWVTPFIIAALWLEWAYPIELAGEAAELFVAFALAASAWRWDPEPSVRNVVLAGVGAAAAVAAVMIGFAALRAGDERSSLARAETAKLLEGAASSLSKHAQSRRSIHKRVFTAVRSGYVTPPAAADGARGGYFIDPWGNPYWLRWDRASSTLTIYSFGPNARRGGGDDLAASTRLPGDEASPPLGGASPQ